MGTEVIIIHGAPGVGKTTVSKELKRKLNAVLMDLDWIRSNHLDDAWSNSSPAEEALSYRILNRTLEEYASSGYEKILLNSADIEKTLQGGEILRTLNYRIFTLVVDDAELRRRVLDPARDSGWRNADGSVSLNRKNQERPLLTNEIRINSSKLNSDETVREILGSI